MEGKRQAGPGKGEGRRAEEGGGGGGCSRVPGSAPHQPSTQSREGSPLESSSCPWRTEGRVPATAARRLLAAALRWKLVAPRPRAAPPAAGAAAAISSVRRLTGARGRREESSPFVSTNGRAAWETRCPMGDRVLCTSRAKGAGAAGCEQAGECGGVGPGQRAWGAALAGDTELRPGLRGGWWREEAAASGPALAQGRREEARVVRCR